jgi:hypothetical protein
MVEFLFSTLWGWLSITAIIVMAAIAVAIVFPPFRIFAIAVAGAAIAAATFYTKGSRDRAALEKRRKDAAVKKVQEKFDAIDKRKDTPKDVEDRLRRGEF